MAFTVTVSPGEFFTEVVLRGGGCAGPNYGVGLEIRDPSGHTFDGDGATTLPDGSWELRERFGSNRAAGRYAFLAACIVANGPQVFSYEPQSFDWTG